MADAEIEIIGTGNIGDKARQLVEKTSKLREIGFYTPRRVVLAEDFFDGFFQRNNLGNNLREAEITPDLETKISNGSLTRGELEKLRRITLPYGRVPLAVRSSAEGDSRGTGIYKSVFSENNPSSIRKSVQEVLASYFSKDAVAFRIDAKTGEGFGVIIEPINGQNIGSLDFAPILSGFGYTSTSRGEGYTAVVPGLGGGVDSRDAEIIFRSEIEKYKTLDGYLDRKSDEKHLLELQPRRDSALVETYPDLVGKVFFYSSKDISFFVDRGDIVLNDKTALALRELNLLNFFGMMKKIEDAFGKPQYFEWSMTIESQMPKFWINQIADTSKKLDLMDFSDLGEILFNAHTVTGTGIRPCYKIAKCFQPADCQSLWDFNENNKNYVLLYSSIFTTGGSGEKLSYSQCRNASVFLELQDASHTKHAIGHWGGELEKAGKFFGVLDWERGFEPNWELFKSKVAIEHGIGAYRGKVNVIASERQNRMVISALD